MDFIFSGFFYMIQNIQMIYSLTRWYTSIFFLLSSQSNLFTTKAPGKKVDSSSIWHHLGWKMASLWARRLHVGASLRSTAWVEAPPRPPTLVPARSGLMVWWVDGSWSDGWSSHEYQPLEKDADFISKDGSNPRMNLTLLPGNHVYYCLLRLEDTAKF